MTISDCYSFIKGSLPSVSDELCLHLSVASRSCCLNAACSCNCCSIRFACERLSVLAVCVSSIPVYLKRNHHINRHTEDTVDNIVCNLTLVPGTDILVTYTVNRRELITPVTPLHLSICNFWTVTHILINFLHLLWKWFLHKNAPQAFLRDLDVNDNVTKNV